MKRSIAVRWPALCLGAVLAGCGNPASTATSFPAAPVSPAGASRPPATASPVPTATTRPLPAGVLAWPAGNDELALERYSIAPPFDVPLTLAIGEAGWYAGHHNPAFTDIQRYDGVPVGGLPTLLLGFALPKNIRGNDGPVPVEGLTPDAALDLLAARGSLDTSGRAPQRLLGLDGGRIDISSAVSNNPVFGSGEGNFGAEPELDLRLVALPHDDSLLLVVVLAPPGKLATAWDRVLPILEAARLADERPPDG